MVGLDGASSDQRISTDCQGIGPQVFQLTQLVAPQGQGRQVITLDVDIAAHPRRQAFELFQRRGLEQQFQTVKTGKLLFDHGVRADCRRCPDYRQRLFPRQLSFAYAEKF